jgi:hypothetical protein
MVDIKMGYVVTHWQGSVQRVQMMKVFASLLLFLLPVVSDILVDYDFENGTITVISMLMSAPAFCLYLVSVFPPPRTRIRGDRLWTFIGCYARPLRGKIETPTVEQMVETNALAEYIIPDSNVRNIQYLIDPVV